MLNIILILAFVIVVLALFFSFVIGLGTLVIGTLTILTERFGRWFCPVVFVVLTTTFVIYCNIVG